MSAQSAARSDALVGHGAGTLADHGQPHGSWLPTERHIDEPKDMMDAYAKAVPMGHMGIPEDVADAVAFLASEAAKFITGQKLSVNGGNSLE